jgi:hypothetical protein
MGANGHVKLLDDNHNMTDDNDDKTDSDDSDNRDDTEPLPHL